MADLDFGAAMDRSIANNTDKLENTFGSSMDAYIGGNKRQQFLGSINTAVDTNPDKFAQEKKVAKDLDIPTAAVQTMPVDTERQARVKEIEANTENAPVLRNKYGDVDFAKLAHDDSKNLSAMETVLNFLGDAAKYITSAPGQETGLLRDIGAAGLQTLRQISALNRAVAAPLADYEEAVNGLLGINGKGPLRSWEEAAGRSAGYFGQQAKDVGSKWSPDSLPAQIFGGGASAGVTSATQNISTAVLASWALGPEIGVPVTLGAMALGQGAESFQNAMEKGAGTFKSLALGAEDATAEYVTEKYLGLAGFMEKALAGAGAKKLLMYEISKEIPGEMAATLWQNFNEWLNLNPEKPLREFIEEQPKALAQTIVATLVGGGGQIGASKALEGTLRKYAEEQAKIRSAQDQRAMIEHLSALTQESRLKARSPEVLQQFVESATDGTPAEELFISANTLMQSGVGEQVAQALPQVAEQLPAALASDGYVRIPTGQWAATIANTPMEQPLIDHLKLDPNGYTFAESQVYAKSFNQEIQAQLEKRLMEHEGDQNFKASRDAIRDQFLSELNQTKRFTGDVNNAYAEMLANFYAVTAAKLGMSPEQLVDRYQLGIRSNQQQNAQFDQKGFYKSLPDLGFARVERGGNRAYKDMGGQEFPTFERDGLRVALSSNNILYTNDKGQVEVGYGEPEESILRAIITDEDVRKQGKASQALAELVDLADQNGTTLYLEPGPIEGGKMSAQQLADFYKRFGFTQATPGSDKVLVRNPSGVFNQRGVQAKGKTVPESVDAVANVEAAFEFAGTHEFPTNRDFKVALQDLVNQAAKDAKVDLTDFSEATEEYLVRIALADGLTALRTNANAVGWYNEKVTKALRLLSLIHPEVATDPQAKFAFVWAMAVTSNGLKVDKNFELAEQAYEKWKASGEDNASRRMPIDIGIGTAAAAINRSLKLYNTLIEKNGFENVENFMTTMQTAGGVEAYTGNKVNGENKTTQVYGAAALGPKIGNGFFMNLYGHFEQLTMDRWLMRTWGRWTGTLVEINQAQIRAKRTQLKELIRSMSPADKKVFEKIIKRKLTVSDIDGVALAIKKSSEKPENRVAMAKIGVFDEAALTNIVGILGEAKKGTERVSFGDELRKGGNALVKYLDGQKEAPSGPPERGNIRKVFSRVLAELQKTYPALTMSDYQALLWYPEKRLYDAAKTADEATESYEDDEAPDYANAAAKLARAKGISEADIAGAIAAVDAELQASNGTAGVRSGSGRSGNSQADQTGVLNQSQPAFYSALARAVESAKQSKAPASDWLSIITKMPGVKAEEIEWTGLKDYLTLLGKEQVTKEQITEYLNANGVQVQEVLLEKPQFDEEPDVIEEGSGYFRIYDGNGNLLSREYYDTEDEALEAVDQLLRDKTKYSKYTLKEGENYRELLLTLPERPKKETWEWYDPDTGESKQGFATQQEAYDDRPGAGAVVSRVEASNSLQNYYSSHWDQANILAHIRFNERTDENGSNILFIEELQSDWAQEGRKKGFKRSEQEIAKFDAEIKAIDKEVAALRAEGFEAPTDGTPESEVDPKFIRVSELLDRRMEIEDEMRDVNRITTAPFVGDTKGWLNLALKRVIRYAAENGYDKVAFVNGKQSSDRYSLSKAVSDISWTDRQDGGRMLMMALTNGTPVQLMIDKDGNVTKAKNLAQAEGKPLDEIVGKDLATKIMREKGGDLEGVEMDVGGEGMKAFYDKIVPNAVSSLIKKMDGKLETIDLEAGKPGDVHSQLGFTVTDKMREMAMQGQPLFQPGSNQAPRGQISFGNDITRTKSILSLLENADLSTFIHESGHFFLQVQADLAARIQAQISAGASVSDGERSIVEDMNKILDWFGVKGDENVTALDRWTQMSLEEQRPYHEQFARGFEAYAFEGKSPTAELNNIFQRFASWMLHIYKAMKNLNVTLTDEVRGVMDRMLATREQIEAAEAARNMGPLFTPQNANGIISDWQAYHNLANDATQAAVDELQTKSLKNVQWESRARSRFLKELQKQHDALRSETRREVTREVMSQPIYQLWQFLTTRAGEEVIPGVTNIDQADINTLRGKIATGPLKEMYGNEADAAWRTLSRLRMTSDKTGMHPELVAELFGFDSADAMVKALTSATPPAQVIDAITDQRMLERHGELVDPKARELAADQAVHNELRAKMLHAEATALERAMQVRGDAGTTKQGRRKTYAVLPKAAQQFAQRLINAIKIRDIRPAQYAASEARAAKAAESEFKAGNLEGAAEQKRIQIINNYATRAAYQAQNDVRAAVAYLRRFDKKSKTLDADYYDQIAQILERFDLVPSTSLKEIDKRTSLAGWLQAQEEQGIVPDIPPAIAAEAFRKSYKDMTVEELMGLRDTVRQLEHLGRLKHKLLTAQDQREFAAIRDEMTESIIANGRGRHANNRTPNTILGEKLVSLKNFWASHIKVATWARIMDGGKDGGPVWEYLIRTANDAGNKEVVAREKATRDLTELIAPVLAQGKLGGKGQFFPSIGRSMNREAVLAMALNIGNESNMQRLLGGEGWTLEQIKPVLDTLTAAEWNFVQAVWDYFETYRPQIAAKERRVYGKEPNWIEPQPLTVETRDGQTLNLRGGYYPVKYDPRASERAESHMEAEDAKRMMQGAYTSATTRRSFTKERVDAVEGRPLLYSLDGIYAGINEVIHDLSWHEWLIDANRIVKNPKIAEAMRDTYGAEVHNQFKSWLKDIAEGDRGTQHSGEKALAWIRQGTSIAGLGINVMSALTQPFGITQSWVRVGSKYIGRGVAKAISDPVGTNAEICQMSDFMRTRSLTRMRELAELRNQVKGQGKFRTNMDAAAYALMLRAQQVVDIPTWWGAYEKATAEGNSQDRAVALADQAVIDAQGSGTTKDLAAIERGGPALKLFTVFYSFMNTALNLGVAQTMTRESKSKLAADYLMIYVVPVVLISLMKSAFTPGDSGEWDDPKKILLKLLKEEVSFLFGLFFGLREMSGIVDAFQGKPQGDYAGPAGTRMIGDTLKLAKQVGQGEMDDGLRKATINVAGELLRLPSAQINRTISGAKALHEGETKNPAALVFGYEKPH